VRGRLPQLLVALVVTVMFAALAQGQFKVDDGDSGGGGGGAQGGGSAGFGDSTSFTLAQFASDTLAWFDMSPFEFPEVGLTAFPLLKYQINTNAAAGDTMRYTIQYSMDQSVLFAKAVAYAIGASPQSLAAVTIDTHGNDPAFGFRYCRLILEHYDGSRTASFAAVTVTPIVIRK